MLDVEVGWIVEHGNDGIFVVGAVSGIGHAAIGRDRDGVEGHRLAVVRGDFGHVDAVAK